MGILDKFKINRKGREEGMHQSAAVREAGLTLNSSAVELSRQAEEALTPEQMKEMAVNRLAEIGNALRELKEVMMGDGEMNLVVKEEINGLMGRLNKVKQRVAVGVIGALGLSVVGATVVSAESIEQSVNLKNQVPGVELKQNPAGNLQLNQRLFRVRQSQTERTERHQVNNPQATNLNQQPSQSNVHISPGAQIEGGVDVSPEAESVGIGGKHVE